MDLDPGPAIFVIDLHKADKKLNNKKSFLLLLFEGTFSSFFIDKKPKKSQNSRNQGFLTIFD